MHCQVAFCTELGPRDRNEDAGIAVQGVVGEDSVCLIGVCDGMGGDRNGQRAAQEVASALSGFLAFLPAYVPSALNPAAQQILIEKAVMAWFQSAQARLDMTASREKLVGMTTTLAACLMWRDVLAVWSLGDSRVYRVRDGKLQRLTRDHSHVEEILKLGED